jgi:hypothetical protein
MKNLSPQKRDVAEAEGTERRSDFGSKFFERPTTCPEDFIPHNSITTGSERTEAFEMKNHR